MCSSNLFKRARIYISCLRTFAKIGEQLLKFKEKRDMAYEDFNINLKDQLLIKYYVIKHFILYLAQYDGYQKGLALMADKVFDGGSATCEDKSAGHTSIGVIKSKLW